MFYLMPQIDVEKTGQRIEELRKKNCLSRQEVQKALGFTSSQAIYKWERGKSVPTLDNMWALSRLFNTSIEELLVDSNEMGEEKSSPGHLTLIWIKQQLLNF